MHQSYEFFLNFAKRNSLVVFSIFGKYMKLSGVDKKDIMYKYVHV